MSDYFNADQSNSLNVKLWRGERMCLLGMDVTEPEPDLAGFSIEVKSPGSPDFEPLRNRLAFSYDKPVDQAVDGYRNFSSLEAPFQNFRWVHFPYEPKGGTYTYRVTKQHMPVDNTLKAGDTVTLDIALDPVIYDGFLDVGFARNYASSQAYNDKYQGNPNIIPSKPDQGLKFKKVPGDVYEWLGFEAYDLIMGILKEVPTTRRCRSTSSPTTSTSRTSLPCSSKWAVGCAPLSTTPARTNHSPVRSRNPPKGLQPPPEAQTSSGCISKTCSTTRC